jgi:hypothetical protein
VTTAGPPKKRQNLSAQPNFAANYRFGARSCVVVATLATGRSASNSSLDLTHFEPQQVKVRFNVNF